MKDRGMETGLLHSKGELMTEEQTEACFRQRGEIINPDWTLSGVIICG
ncbi:MAG: hypothetical protein ABFD66_09210 [Smithella sp.]